MRRQQTVAEIYSDLYEAIISDNEKDLENSFKNLSKTEIENIPNNIYFQAIVISENISLKLIEKITPEILKANIQNNQNCNIFTEACDYNYPKLIEKLTEYLGKEKLLEILTRENYGYNPLEILCETGNVKSVRLFISLFSKDTTNLIIKGYRKNYASIGNALRCGHIEIAQTLFEALYTENKLEALKHLSSPDFTLEEIIKKDYIESFNFLLSNIQPENKNSFLQLVFNYACMYDKPEFAKLCLEKSHKTSHLSIVRGIKNNFRSLGYPAESGEIEIFKLLDQTILKEALVFNNFYVLTEAYFSGNSELFIFLSSQILPEDLHKFAILNDYRRLRVGFTRSYFMSLIKPIQLDSLIILYKTLTKAEKEEFIKYNQFEVFREICKRSKAEIIEFFLNEVDGNLKLEMMINVRDLKEKYEIYRLFPEGIVQIISQDSNCRKLFWSCRLGYTNIGRYLLHKFYKEEKAKEDSAIIDIDDCHFVLEHAYRKENFELVSAILNTVGRDKMANYIVGKEYSLFHDVAKYGKLVALMALFEEFPELTENVLSSNGGLVHGHNMLMSILYYKRSNIEKIHFLYSLSPEKFKNMLKERNYYAIYKLSDTYHGKDQIQIIRFFLNFIPEIDLELAITRPLLNTYRYNQGHITKVLLAGVPQDIAKKVALKTTYQDNQIIGLKTLINHKCIVTLKAILESGALSTDNILEQIKKSKRTEKESFQIMPWINLSIYIDKMAGIDLSYVIEELQKQNYSPDKSLQIAIKNLDDFKALSHIPKLNDFYEIILQKDDQELLEKFQKDIKGYQICYRKDHLKKYYPKDKVPKVERNLDSMFRDLDDANEGIARII